MNLFLVEGSSGCVSWADARSCELITMGEWNMLIYGLRTCSVCQRARKELEAGGKEVEFRDVRAEPLAEDELAELIVEFGDRLVDRTTNDYRSLNDWLKNSEAEAQIAAKPKVMARPVIRDGDALYLGWDEKVQSALLAG
jgi:arsenate reductase-like glutaredoxin family protein